MTTILINKSNAAYKDCVAAPVDAYLPRGEEGLHLRRQVVLRVAEILKRERERAGESESHFLQD